MKETMILVKLVVILFCMIYVCSTETCSATGSCANSIYVGGTQLLCSGTNSCRGVLVNCTGSCFISCDGNNSCNYMNYNCNSGTCQIECTGGGSCLGLNLKCDPNTNCVRSCYSNASCNVSTTPSSSRSFTSSKSFLPSASRSLSSSTSRSSSLLPTPTSSFTPLPSSPYNLPINNTITLSCSSPPPNSYCINNTLYINSSLTLPNSTIIITQPVIIQGPIYFNNSQIIFQITNNTFPQLITNSTIIGSGVEIIINVTTSSQIGEWDLMIGQDMNVTVIGVSIVGMDTENCMKSNAEVKGRTLVWVVSADDECGGQREKGGINRNVVVGVVVGVGGFVLVAIVILALITGFVIWRKSKAAVF
eukprot:TRINITY_DN801_c0_g2_i1.p1 TRINITY_DN801_c0_g2~~TRINITY_DN801_c0_g2_i1.p1  ORF type:complete len:362 (+),score=52.36 TRINITY_DN801_c0_g2_i1:61-1146(+)